MSLRPTSLWTLLPQAALLAACAQAPVEKPAPVGLTDVLARPAERALLDGQRAYDDGQYPAAEAALQKALAAGLASGRDRALAHKLIAFIACTSDREAACEEAFRAARAADPAFTLSRSEAGHPLWGPVYRRVAPR
jgi:Tfp pilus assembly protein PilF